MNPGVGNDVSTTTIRNTLASSQQIAREKAAIDHELTVLALNVEVLHNTLSNLQDRVQPVSSNQPPQDSVAREDDYRGSSQVYDRLHSLTLATAIAIRRIEDITGLLEV